MSEKYRPLIPDKYRQYYMYNEATPEMIEKNKAEKKDKMIRKRMATPSCKYGLGNTVRKKFGKTWYVGKVVDYLPDKKYYKVLYEDGDREDMDDEDMEDYLYDCSSSNKRPRNV